MRPDVHTLAGAYAMDAVDDLERTEFDRHLARCTDCAREVAELRTTAASLADLVAIQPPPRLRAAVLSQARRTRQVSRRHRGPTQIVGGVPGRWRLVVAAAAVGLIVGGTGAGTYVVQELRVQRAQEQAAQADQIATVLGAADGQEYAQPVPGGGQVRVVVSDSLEQAVAIMSGLPAPGAGHSYQLWLIRDTQPVNAGMVLTSGTDTRLLADMRGAGTFAVSWEPTRTVARTPTKVLLEMTL